MQVVTGLDFDVNWLGIAALLALAIGGLAWWRRSRVERAHIAFSDLAGLTLDKPSLRVRLARLPSCLRLAALGLLLLALPDPRIIRPLDAEEPPSSLSQGEEFQEGVEIPTEGVALYFVLDRSSSMKRELIGTTERLSRLQSLKRLTARFVRGRSQDLVGLIAFARTAHVLAPLTLDHGTVLDELNKLKAASIRSEDGTAIGYAIFKTASLIAATQYFSQETSGEQRPAYEIQSAAMVLVTDGLQGPNPLDISHELRTMSVESAADFAAGQGIKLYIINIEPMIRYPQLASAREALQTAAEKTGGRFYIADDPDTLGQIYSEIDHLERSELPEKQRVHAKIQQQRLASAGVDGCTVVSLVPPLVALALILLLAAIALDSTWLRRVP